MVPMRPPVPRRLSAAQLIGQSYATQVISDQTQLTGRSAAINPPLEVRTEVWYNPDLVSAYFMIPGVIGMILNFTTTLLTASTIVRERERGTIEQLIVTPIRSWELVIGKIAPYVFLGLTNTAEVMLIGHFWFDVPVRSSLGLIIGHYLRAPAFKSWYRFVGIHNCQHSTGGLSDRHVYNLAERFPVGVFLSTGSHASFPAMGFVSNSSALLPYYYSFADD